MLFINNKYTKWYYQIIESAKSNPPEGYSERHHIIPKSIGGSNSKDNLVKLTARQHYIVHLLLTKMAATPEHKKKFWRAYWCMSKLHWKTHERYNGPCASRFYDKAKQEFKFSSHMVGRKASKETRQKMSKSLKGRVVSDETRKKIGAANRERAKNRPPISDSTRKKLIEASTGRIWSDDSRKKASDSAKERIKKYGKPKGNKTPNSPEAWAKFNQTVQSRGPDWKMKPREKVTCPHCNKTGDITGMKRYHFNNCKAASYSDTLV